MQNWDWKTWALIFVIAIGACFELIKHMPGRDAIAWDKENLRLSTDSQPYSVAQKMRRGRDLPQAQLPAQPQPAKVAGNSGVTREMLEKFIAANKPQETTFDKGAEGKPTADIKKKKEDDEWEIIVDPKTGKKYKRKKKKKDAKKKEEEKKEEVAPVTPPQEEPKQADSDVDVEVSEAIATGTFPPADQTADEPFSTLEDWQRRLLARPDWNETKRFVEHYQKHLITPDVFYKIVDMMLEDSRPQMKQMGVFCAAMTPSMMSFQLLAQTLKTERSGSSTRSQIEQALNRYTDKPNMHILESTLKQATPSYVTVVAAQKLEAAARRYLLAPPPAKPPKNPAQQNQVRQANINYFQRFVTILQGLTKVTDSAVNDQARRTLSSLQAMLTTAGGGTTAGNDPNLPPDDQTPPGQTPPGQMPPTQASVDF